MDCEYIAFRDHYNPPKEIVPKLSGDRIFLANKKWTQLNMPEVCPFIIEWKAVRLIIYCNLHKSILKEIAEIHFSKLTFLNGSDNNIESVEAINRIYMPQFLSLTIDNNKIINIKSIRKMKCPFLTALDLWNNAVHDGCTLTKISATSLK